MIYSILLDLLIICYFVEKRKYVYKLLLFPRVHMSRDKNHAQQATTGSSYKRVLVQHSSLQQTPKQDDGGAYYHLSTLLTHLKIQTDMPYWPAATIVRHKIGKGHVLQTDKPLLQTDITSIYYTSDSEYLL